MHLASRPLPLSCCAPRRRGSPASRCPVEAEDLGRGQEPRSRAARMPPPARRGKAKPQLPAQGSFVLPGARAHCGAKAGTARGGPAGRSPGRSPAPTCAPARGPRGPGRPALPRGVAPPRARQPLPSCAGSRGRRAPQPRREGRACAPGADRAGRRGAARRAGVGATSGRSPGAAPRGRLSLPGVPSAWGGRAPPTSWYLRPAT